MVLTFSFAVLAQGGGKAEPLKIEFKRGAKSAVVGETIRSGEEWDFVFAARAGQKISLKISSTPKDKSAAFRVFQDETGYAEKSKLYYDLTFTAPETGDYFMVVQHHPNAKVKKARFSLTLRIE